MFRLPEAFHCGGNKHVRILQQIIRINRYNRDLYNSVNQTELSFGQWVYLIEYSVFSPTL